MGVNTIYKYPLEVSKRNVITTYAGWVPRLFAEQNGVPTLWAQVNTDSNEYECRLLISKTGTDIKMGSIRGNLRFVGSCIIGKNVLFLYEGS